VRRTSLRRAPLWYRLVHSARSSLALKLAVFVGGIVLLTAGSIGFAGLAFTDAVISAQVDQRLSIIAADRRDMLSAYIRGQKDEINVVAKRPLVRQLLDSAPTRSAAGTPFSAAAARALADAEESINGMHALWIANPSGDVVASSDEQYLGRSFAADPVFTGGLVRPQLGFPSLSDDRYQARVSAPVRGPSGETIGVIMGLVDVTPLASISSDPAGLGKTGDLLVGAMVDGEIDILLPNRFSDPVPNLAPADVPAMARSLEGKRGFLRMRDYRGNDVLAAYEPATPDGWGIVATIDASEAYGSAEALRFILAGIGVLILSAGLYASWLLARRFTEPIRRMAEASTNVAHGQLTERVPVTSIDEIGTLQQSFNLMTKRLAESYDSLENRVRQRTRQLRAANEQLEEQSRRAQAANRAKSEFLASMSHELRTPLNAIIGFSELLIDEQPSGYDHATRASYLSSIYESGKHLLTLINDILDLSKVEAGRMELRPERFSLAETVQHVLSTVEPLAAAKHIRFSADTAYAGDVVADEGKVKQILYNLVSNAIKFTPDDGRIHVSIGQDASGTVVSVEDSGIGIAPEDRERIFLEFQQLDAGPGRQHEGTGLGLALTKRFVELHGGRIWVDGEPGQGSIFRFTLPTPTPADDEDPITEVVFPIAEVQMPEDPRGLVLVVEDDPRSANLVALYLARGGYRVEMATNGREAIEKAQALRPIAITLDVILPDLDGWEVLKELKQNEVTREIPVVIISVVDNQRLGFALGADDYLVKPIDRNALLSRLEQYGNKTPTQRQTARVLLIDDTPSALELYQGMLSPAGYTALTASGGAEGIRLARSEHPDVILLDLMMPEVSGFDVVTTLKSDPETQDIPILIVTAKELTEADKAALNGRVSTILQKGSMATIDLLSWLNDTVSRLGRAREVAGAIG